MQKLTTKIISFILTLSFIFSASVPAFAMAPKLNAQAAYTSPCVAAAAPLVVLEAELIALDLPVIIQGFLITIGGTMSALGGSKLLQKACIVNLFLTTAGGITPIITNWDLIKPKWHKIIQAFQKAFGANSSNIEMAFKDIEVKA